MDGQYTETFYGYASRKQAVVMIAGFTPLLTLLAWSAVINASDPMVLRLAFFALTGTSALLLVGPLHRLLVRGPIITVDARGFKWRGWSGKTIPWEAVDRWKTTRCLNIRYVTIWLRDPRDHRSTTPARWTQWANSWLKQGHISIPEGGLRQSHEEVASAFSRFAPKPPFPDDPRLARRLLRSRNRR